MTTHTTSGPIAPEVATGRRRQQGRALALATIAFAASAPGQSFLISVFVDDFLHGTGLSRTAFSLLYAGGTVVSAAAMILLGRLVDQRGLRIAWVAVATSLAIACGLASVATGAFLAFLALALLRTAGQGSFTLVGTLLVARSFERRRGRAIAVANLGLTLSSVVLPPAVALLIVATDWRSTYQIIGAALLIVVLPLATLVRVPEVASPGARPADAGPGGYPAAVRPTHNRLPNVPSRQAARLLAVLAAPPLVGTALTFHATSILDAHGIGYVEAGGVIGLLGATSAAGVVLSGLFLDRVRSTTMLVLLSVAVLIATLVLLVPSRPAAYTAFAVLGLALGSAGVVNGTVWATTFGTAQLGRVQGMAQSSMITAAAVAPLIPALSLGLTGTHTAGLVALAAIAALALMLAACPRRPISPDARVGVE
jgi:MFS family permease